MPDNDIIRHGDIAEDGALKPFQQELIATIQILQNVDANLQGVAKTIKKTFDTSDTGSSKGLRDVGNNAKTASSALDEHEKVVRKLKQTNAQLVESFSAESKELAQVRYELQQNTAANKENAKWISDSNSAYQKASQNLRRMIKDYKDLHVVGKERTEQAKALLSAIQQEDAALKHIDATVGQFGRSVGNYKSGFQGLRHSINQLTREGSAFVYSFQTGILALSNNIPTLADEMKKLTEINKQLKAQGEKTVPVWKQMVSGIFSWQTALSVAITMMTFYGKEIGEFFGKLIKSNKALESNVEIQKQVNEANQAAIKNTVEENVKLSILLGTAKDVTLSLEDRKKAVDQLQELYPAYFGNLKDEEILAGNTAVAELKLRDAILAKARATAITSKITENEVKILDLKLEKSELATKIAVAEGKAQDAINRSMNAPGSDKAGFDVLGTQDDLNELKEDALEIDKEIAAQQAINNSLLGMAIKSSAEASGLDIKKKTGAKEVIKETNEAQELELKRLATIHRINENLINQQQNASLKQIGLIQEDLRYQIEVNEIKITNEKERQQERILLEAEANQKINELRKKHEYDLSVKKIDGSGLWAETERNRKKGVADRKKAQEEEVKQEQLLLMQATKILDNATKKRLDIIDKGIDKELDANQKRQDALRELAAKGVQDAQNNLAFEQRKEAELEAKRIKNEKNRVRAEMISSGLKAYAANLNTNPNGAGKKTLTDITQLIAGLSAIPTFFDGTEDTGEGGNLDHNGGFMAKLHRKERVVDAENNKALLDAGIKNDELPALAKLYTMLNPTSFDKVPMSNHYHDDAAVKEIQALRSDIGQIKNVIENRPVHDYKFDEGAKLAVHIVATKHKKEITYSKKGGLFGNA